MKILTLVGLLPLAVSAQQTTAVKTPQQIQSELDQAQRDFERARDLFIPWYTGPLITGSANNVPKGRVNVQPYIFFNNLYALYTDSRGTTNVPDIFTIQPLFLYQYGLNDFTDSTLILDGFFNWREGAYAQGFGDITYALGFQIFKQTPDRPSIRLTIGEIFPTGKFRTFHPDKAAIEGTGGGTFASQFGLFINKIFFRLKKHPVSARLAGIYTLTNHHAHVKGFNTYGGGFGTDGHVCVGDSIDVDLGIEVSLTQKWVFATDMAYTFSFPNSFSGFLGTNPDGTPATVGGPSSDQLSFAPAIEYNPSANGGFIGGIWFSATGRNSPVFVAGILSYTQLF